MTRQELQRLVEHEIASFEYVAPAPGTAIGSPWPEAKIRSHIEKLKDALIKPYEQRFVLRGSLEQISKSPPDEANYWVVAELGDYLEFYDPLTDEFGFAIRDKGGSSPKTIGVRGDLIGTLIAM